MKTSKIVLVLFLASALLGATARAADPQPPAPSAADLQALMAILNKLVAQSAAAANEAAPDAEPEPAPAVKVPATLEKQPLSTALKTGGLSTGGLGGHGPGIVARLTEEAWRLLFSTKQPVR